MNGKINNNVGFSRTEGRTRRLTIREQLIQVRDFKGINDILHPMLGRIPVDRSKVSELLLTDDSHLLRYKASMFN